MHAAWLGGSRPGLASLEFAHNGEERAMLGHHTFAPIATEAAGTVHLQLNVLVGGMPAPERAAAPGSPNPAERRAGRLLAMRLQQISAKDSPEQFMSGLEIVRKVRCPAAPPFGHIAFLCASHGGSCRQCRHRGNMRSLLLVRSWSTASL